MPGTSRFAPMPTLAPASRRAPPARSRCVSSAPPGLSGRLRAERAVPGLAEVRVVVCNASNSALERAGSTRSLSPAYRCVRPPAHIDSDALTTYGAQDHAASSRDVRTLTPTAPRRRPIVRARSGSGRRADVGSSRWPAVKAGIVRPPAPVSCPTAPVSCPTAPVSCPTAPAPHPTAPAPHPTAPAPHPTGPVWCPTGPAPYPTAPASHRTARAPIRFPAPPVGCSPGSCLARLSFRANRGSLPAGCRPSQGWPSFCPVLRSERRRDRAAPPGPIAAAI